MMNYYGIYAQHILKFGNGKFVLNDGIRLQATFLRATISDNSFFHFPFTEIEQNNKAITGNAGLVYMPDEKWRFQMSLSTGFRTPNIDDLSKIFESNTASRQLIIPNPGIKPEYTLSFDLGAARAIAGKYRAEINGFYTLFKSAIALAPFQLNGMDSFAYNGIISKLFANQNVNRAFIYGFHASIGIDITTGLNFFSAMTFTYGRLKPTHSSLVPLDHIPPLYGKTSISYSGRLFKAELYALYNGWKRLKDYNPSGEDNAQYATAQGTPSWLTVNFKSSLNLFRQMVLQAGVENLFDLNYRYFASGFSAAGRNFIVALRTHF